MGSRRGNAGGKDTPVRSVHQDELAREQELVLDLDEIARQGARKMLAQALQAEVDAYLKAAEDERDERHQRSREGGDSHEACGWIDVEAERRRRQASEHPCLAAPISSADASSSVASIACSLEGKR